MEELELTDGEKKIVSALERLERLWAKYGNDLCLFNGHSLRKGGVDASKEIAFYGDINGEGGDGGDIFE